MSQCSKWPVCHCISLWSDTFTFLNVAFYFAIKRKMEHKFNLNSQQQERHLQSHFQRIFTCNKRTWKNFAIKHFLEHWLMCLVCYMQSRLSGDTYLRTGKWHSMSQVRCWRATKQTGHARKAVSGQQYSVKSKRRCCWRHTHKMQTYVAQGTYLLVLKYVALGPMSLCWLHVCKCKHVQ